MKALSPRLRKRGRLEIIPLIDIMFFLLASFMMASLSMMRLQSLRMDLPTATAPQRSKEKPDIINMKVDKLGDIYVDDKLQGMAELHLLLSNRFKANTNLPVYITGAKDATHGAVIHALDVVRREGIQNVSFNIGSDQAEKK